MTEIDLSLLAGVTRKEAESWLERFHGGIWPFLLSREGGFSNAVTDAGGPTKYGVTWITLKDVWRKAPAWCSAHGLPEIAQSATAAEAVKPIKLITAEQAFWIAFVFYYARPRIAQLVAPWDLACLDWRYNGGPAIRELQVVGGFTGRNVDGIIGELTKLRTAALELQDLERYFMKRLEYLKGLKGGQGWEANGNGWKVRLRMLRYECLDQWYAARGITEWTRKPAW